MRTLPSTAFYNRLQENFVPLCDLIDIEMTGFYSIRWTTSNQPITYTLSGVATTYEPFPGKIGNGPDSDVNLGVSVVELAMANSGSTLQAMIASDAFVDAAVKVGYVFSDTPDMGRIDMFDGTMGEFGYNRMEVTGQARGQFKSISVQWPYYTYQDRCVWRFGSAGCGFNTAAVAVAINSINVGSSTTQFLRVANGYLSSYPNGRFDFGRATLTAGYNSGHIRTIKSHTGDLLELSRPLPVNSLINTQLTIFPGCRKSLIADCKSLYNNTNNFLGFPWIPVQEQAYVA